MSKLNSRQVLVEKAKSLGWSVEFVQFCEDTETPGMLGGIGGVCCVSRKAIKVSTFKRSERDICDILSHEIDHVLGVAVEGEAVGSVAICGGRRNAFGEVAPV